MRVVSPGAVDIRQRAVREDSDVIVALIRTAFIIAYYVLWARGYPRPGMDAPPDYLWRFALEVLNGVALTSALFNLLLLALYLRGHALRRLRPLALLVDLVLIGTAVVVFQGAGADTSDLYYLIILPAAVWYRRAGAVVMALLAGVTAAVAPHMLFQYHVHLAAAVPQGAFLLLIGLIAGYMMQAREAERQSVLEIRQEMRMARVLQSRMLPEGLPELPDWDIGLVFEPARQVGGDFYDVRLLDPDHLLVVMADMAGKSVYGLVHLSLVHSHLQAALHEGLEPAEAAKAVNEGTYEALQPESYAALFLGVLRLSDGTLTFANCGHVPPVVVRAHGTAPCTELSTGGMVIGAWREAKYTERQVTLEPGDMLLCFSDGVSEGRNRHRELFGEDQVCVLARERQQAGAQSVVEHLHAAVEKFAARPGQDDLTLIALRRR